MTDFATTIAELPLIDIIENIDWEAMGDLLAEFGLDEILPIDTLKAFADDLVVQLEDPNG